MYIILGTIAIIFGISFLVFTGNVFYYLVYFSFYPLEKPQLKTAKNMKKEITIEDLKINGIPPYGFAEKTKEQEKGKLAPKSKPPTKQNSKK